MGKNFPDTVRLVKGCNAEWGNEPTQTRNETQNESIVKPAVGC